jgi:hypothetical protein
MLLCFLVIIIQPATNTYLNMHTRNLKNRLAIITITYTSDNRNLRQHDTFNKPNLMVAVCELFNVKGSKRLKIENWNKRQLQKVD